MCRGVHLDHLNVIKNTNKKKTRKRTGKGAENVPKNVPKKWSYCTNIAVGEDGYKFCTECRSKFFIQRLFENNFYRFYPQPGKRRYNRDYTPFVGDNYLIEQSKDSKNVSDQSIKNQSLVEILSVTPNIRDISSKLSTGDRSADNTTTGNLSVTNISSKSFNWEQPTDLDIKNFSANPTIMNTFPKAENKVRFPNSAGIDKNAGHRSPSNKIHISSKQPAISYHELESENSSASITTDKSYISEKEYSKVSPVTSNSAAIPTSTPISSYFSIQTSTPTSSNISTPTSSDISTPKSSNVSATSPKNIIDTSGNKKTVVSAATKKLVWKTYFPNKNIHVCYCCRSTTIESTGFVAGHVVPNSQGGSIKVGNLRPICTSCNSMMSVNHMFQWMKDNEMPGWAILLDESNIEVYISMKFYNHDHTSSFEDFYEMYNMWNEREGSRAYSKSIVKPYLIGRKLYNQDSDKVVIRSDDIS